MNIVKINHTYEYDTFQFIDGNRKISRKHVEILKKDPTFPKGFQTCPIIVTADRAILDGQHRFTAAEELGIGVYFYVDYDATENHAVIRNSQQKPWKLQDYINFHKSRKKDYEILFSLKDRYKVSCTFIVAAIDVLYDMDWGSTFSKIKNGLPLFNDNGKQINKFFETYVEIIKIKRTHSVKSEIWRPLFTLFYVRMFALLFKSNTKRYQEALDKLASTSYHWQFTGSDDECKKQIMKMCGWQYFFKDY